MNLRFLFALNCFQRFLFLIDLLSFDDFYLFYFFFRLFIFNYNRVILIYFDFLFILTLFECLVTCLIGLLIAKELLLEEATSRSLQSFRGIISILVVLFVI